MPAVRASWRSTPARRPGSTSWSSELMSAALLHEFLPPAASVTNPIDMVASAGPDEYRRAIEVVLSASDVDGLIVVFTPIDNTTYPGILGGIQAGIASARSRGFE